MFCSNCGSQVAEGERFCSKCGNAIRANMGTRTAGASGENVGAWRQQASQGYGSQGYGSQGTSPQPNRGQTVYCGQHNGAVRDNRSLLSYILLSIITLGIYSFYYIYKMAQDTNIVCAGEGKKTSGLAVFILLSIITLGIYSYYWEYTLQERLRATAPRYGVTVTRGGGTILGLSLGGLFLAIIISGISGGALSYVAYVIGVVMILSAAYILIHTLNDVSAGYNRANGYVYQG